MLVRELTTMLTGGVDIDDPSVPQRLRHAGALLLSDDGPHLWPLAKFVLYEACDRLMALGRLNLTILALTSVNDWFEQLPPEVGAERTWLRERSVLRNRQGEVRWAQGDLTSTLRAYEESLAIARQLAASDPSNTQWQRDLSFSLRAIASVHELNSDFDQALQFAGESFAIIERLMASDPTNVTWRNDVQISRNQVDRLKRHAAS